jgi:hypothetical protein
MRAPAVIDVDLVGQDCLFLRASGSFSEHGIAWCAGRLARLAALDFPCVALDLGLITDIDAAGRLLVDDFMATLHARGRRVVVTDPAGLLSDRADGDPTDATDPLVA